MLELKNITKDYPTGNETVHALRGVSLSFRKSEFVSILGQSGCGKTTLLNIIGGLDRYTSGDLVINGRSTKKYNDRDWDTYRNHSVGFVFQSYNLIPHQTVLQNVELALTLSGVKKSERRRRAKEALNAVGLSSQLNKRPSEMSGGQMQRVAIARAIVNDPDIILADEPTGALDSETSVQVMEILKEISKERLVVMVTHNPELAEKYSTRTVRMLDGLIISDSNPISDSEIKSYNDEISIEAKSQKKIKKPSMSAFTSFGLSLRNLVSKKGRTILTSFAGSIGIIGIALIFAVSNGMTNYITLVQENTLSSYPITLEAQHVSMGSLMEMFIGSANKSNDHTNDAVYQKPVLFDLVNTLSAIEAKQNDLKSFKNYLDTKLSSDENKKYNSAINGIQYTYNLDFAIYTENVDGNIIKTDTEELVQEMLIKFMSQVSGQGNTTTDSSMLSMLSNPASSSMLTVWQEMLPEKDGSPINSLILKQYDLLAGKWPESYDEIVIIVDENNEIDDMTLYALGLLSENEIDSIIDAAVNKGTIDYNVRKWEYTDILGMEFRTILTADKYTLQDGFFVDTSKDELSLKYLYNNDRATKLKVTGIIKLNEDASTTMLQGTIGYTHYLTQHIIELNKTSASINAQLSSPTHDIFTGLPFSENKGNIDPSIKAATFLSHVSMMSVSEKADTFIKIKSIPDENFVRSEVNKQLSMIPMETLREQLVKTMASQSSLSEEKLREYVSSLSDDQIKEFVYQNLAKRFSDAYAANQQKIYESYSEAQLATMLDSLIAEITSEQAASYYDTVLEFSASTFEQNLTKLGYVDINEPSSINLYASSFAEKDVIEEMINDYNNSVDDVSRIEYTDYMGIMMASITTIIDAITYVLAAFVSVSLIVSSIMIGVITLISVQERTKEIGILRAIGASKKNVCGMFNAETLIIGFASGLLGVIVTYLLCIPINLILYALTGLSGLKAVLPLPIGLALIVISLLLTLISGLIPSRSAAKKDPVVALRTE